MKQLSVPIIKLPTSYDFDLPAYEYDLASSVNIQAAISSSIRMSPGDRVFVPTGFCIALPLGFEARITTHTQTALEYGLIVCDSPASIDASYRGEVKCFLYNASSDIVIVRRGMFIAKMSFLPVTKAVWNEVRPNENR